MLFRPSLWIVAVLIAAAAAAQARQFSLSIDDLEAPGFSAKALKASLRGAAERELLLEIGTVTIQGHTWRNVQVRCPQLRLESSLVECRDAVMDTGAKIPLSFSYSGRKKNLEVELRPAPQEIWKLHAAFGSTGGGAFTIKIGNGRLDRLASWLPAGVVKPSGGAINGTIDFADTGHVSAQIRVDALAFSDAAGLHAGDKIKAAVTIEAEHRGNEWHWRANAGWSAGEVFWQPLYVTASGQQLSAEGVSDPVRTQVTRGELTLPGIGSVGFSGSWDGQTGKVVSGEVRSSRLRAGPLYTEILKPFLVQTALGDLRADGDISVTLQIADGNLRAVDAELDAVSVEDRNRRFALFGVDGHVPWQQNGATLANITVKGGEALRLPFGAFRLPLNMKGMQFGVAGVEVPLLDGKLTVNDFSAEPDAGGWGWSFSGALTPISMPQFAQSIGLPTMHGIMSGVIPKVSYEKSTLTIDGALLFRVFDGTIVAKKVRLFDPFGKAPRMQADLDVRGLDLDLLTRTFSFGNITGRIDAQVSGLELANWQPVRFDARVESSAGDYPRKISQKAVQNISALGGAGAAAAIQRSFLGFFKQFGYQKLGLSCKLRNNVCEMGGVEDAPQGYVIVKGGGIPAITVIGYNRYVSWQELIDRLKRIMQDNVHAIVE